MGKIVPYTEKELEVLEKWANRLPIEKILGKIRSVNRAEGKPERTYAAVELKLKHMGYGRKCTLDNFSLSAFAECLGVKRDRVIAWVTLHGLRSRRKVDGRIHCIRVKDFQAWVEAGNYDRIWGIDPEILNWLLGDVDWDIPSDPPNKRRKVKNTSTGAIYPSISAAARASFITVRAIQLSLHSGQRACDAYWEFVE